MRATEAGEIVWTSGIIGMTTATGSYNLKLVLSNFRINDVPVMDTLLSGSDDDKKMLKRLDAAAGAAAARNVSLALQNI